MYTIKSNQFFRICINENNEVTDRTVIAKSIETEKNKVPFVDIIALIKKKKATKVAITSKKIFIQNNFILKVNETEVKILLLVKILMKL